MCASASAFFAIGRKLGCLSDLDFYKLKLRSPAIWLLRATEGGSDSSNNVNVAYARAHDAHDVRRGPRRVSLQRPGHSGAVGRAEEGRGHGIQLTRTIRADVRLNVQRRPTRYFYLHPARVEARRSASDSG